MKQNLKAQIENLIGHNIELKISPNRIEVTLEGSQYSNDITAYYEEPWFIEDGDTQRNYRVQTTSWGAIRPTSIFAKGVLLQALLLTNEELIASVKAAILNFKR